MRKSKQLLLLKNEPKEYGGELLKTRKGRKRGRPLDTKNSMHLVLRSSKAKGDWSFRRPQNARKVALILKKFGNKYGVSILSIANVGNHLHLHIKLSYRQGYKPFIRAVTAAIAMAITGISRWNRGRDLAARSRGSQNSPQTYAAQTGHTNKQYSPLKKIRFWDLRPYTRVVIGCTAWHHLVKYIRVNQLEGMGFNREAARAVMLWPDMAELNSG